MAERLTGNSRKYKFPIFNFPHPNTILKKRGEIHYTHIRRDHGKWKIDMHVHQLMINPIKKSLLRILLIILCLMMCFRSSRVYGGSDDEKMDFITINRSKNSIELKIDLRNVAYEIVFDKQGEAQILMPGFNINEVVGEPSLPWLEFRLGLPLNTRRDSIEFQITNLQDSIIFSDISIPPPNSPLPACDCDNKIPHGVGFEHGQNESVYQKNQYFPITPINLSPVSRINEWIYLPIKIWPFQYNPLTGSLQRMDYCELQIRFTQDGTITDLVSESMKSEYHGMITGSLPTSSLLNVGNGYAIITTNDIVSNSQNLERFIAHKENGGFSVYLVTESDFSVLQGQSPNGTAEKIRQWLINNYQVLDLKYVLLIGNPDPDDPTDPIDQVGDIPMKMLFPRVGNGYYWDDYASPSDYYYADLSGNWNLDGDDLFGEHKSILEPVVPDPQIDENTYSIRWTGRIDLPDPEGTRIAAYFDDGVRIWIDDLLGDPVIDMWSDHVAGHQYYDITTPGLHDIKIEYYQNNSNAFFRLLKGSLGAGWYSTVNASELFYWNGEAYQQGGLVGEYFNNPDLSEFVFSRVDPFNPTDAFTFQWFSGDRGEGGVDFSPEVVVGRIPVYDGNYPQLDDILNKTIAYQYAPDISWRRSVLLPMKPFSESTPNYQLGEQIRTEICEPNQLLYHRIYEENYGCSPSPETIPCTEEKVLAAWENPFGLITWATHGSSSNASDVLSTASCSLLDNQRPAFVMQGSCNNGYPEDHENLGYALLKQGAIATVSASRTSWYNPGVFDVEPGNLFIQGFDYYFSKYLIEGNSAGESLNLIKDTENLYINSYLWMNIFDFNLYGDPDLSLFGVPLEDHTPPNVPELSSPMDGAFVQNENIELSWQPSTDELSGLDHYLLEYANNSGFMDAFSIEVVEPNHLIPGELTDASYYWRVKAIDTAMNQSNWSETWHFITKSTYITYFPVIQKHERTFE
jgi:hypothetical protein